MTEVKTDKDIEKGILRKVARERARLRLSHRSPAFRELLIMGADTSIELCTMGRLKQYGLGTDEPTASTPNDVFSENNEKMMNCWAMVTIIINSASDPDEKNPAIVARREPVMTLVPKLTKEEWKRLRYFVVRTHGSDGYTPWIGKKWRLELDELRKK